jgi:large subunit ribosomal protein L13
MKSDFESGKGFDAQKTKQLTKEQALKDRGWYVIDASGLTLGRLASQVAHILRGKHKPSFTPHVDCGDFVIVTNASQIVLKGNKLSQKKYYRHTGYIGGIKETLAGDMRDKNPEQMIKLAVKRMVKRGALGHQIIQKLKVYRGEEHPHSAQKPQVLTLH